MARPDIAVVGSGVSGLTAAYLLSRSGDVTLYEQDGRLGGHAHTHHVAAGGHRLALDSGFLVHNRRTYPLLCRLFDELGVRTQQTEMSMSVCCAGCGLQYAGARGLGGLLPTPRTALRGRYLRTLARVPAFHRAARRLLEEPGADATDPGPALGVFLAAHGFSDHFANHVVTPLVSAVWSCPGRTALDYPARYLFRFLDQHGLLSVTGSPRWRTVVGGSERYVQRIAKQNAAVRPGVPVRAVRRGDRRAQVVTDDGVTREHDAVVLATHADEALSLLADATPVERTVLSAFGYQPNEAVLHTDSTVLPPAGRARASWNQWLPDCAAGAGDVLISYHLNRLQRLAEPVDYLVTLNPRGRVREARVIARMTYRHPVYTARACAAQQRLPELTSRVTAYAGAYHGWGFHEDGCRSGVMAAAALGVRW